MITGVHTVDLIAPRVLFTLGIGLRGLSDATAGEKIGGENNLLEVLQRTATALDDLKFSVSAAAAGWIRSCFCPSLPVAAHLSLGGISR